MSFIKIIYFDLNHIFLNVDYLSERVILVLININVEIINKTCINRFRDSIFYKQSFDRAIDLEMIEKFIFECFHHYDEIFLLSYILHLKIDMFVMLLRNIRSLVMCNEIRARITRVDNNVMKIEIIIDKYKNEIIVIFRILLNFKNDEINKERKQIVSCHFTRRQYFI